MALQRPQPRRKPVRPPRIPWTKPSPRIPLPPKEKRFARMWWHTHHIFMNPWLQRWIWAHYFLYVIWIHNLDRGVIAWSIVIYGAFYVLTWFVRDFWNVPWWHHAIVGLLIGGEIFSIWLWLYTRI